MKIENNNKSEDIINYLNKKQNKACKIADLYLDKLMDEKFIQTASFHQLAAAFGTIIDKFTKQSTGVENGQLELLIKGLKENGEGI